MKYIISGTSSGLGFEIASDLLENGEVIGISRTIGKSLIHQKNKKFHHLEYDLSAVDDVITFKKLINEIENIVKNEEVTLILNAAKFYMGINRLNYLETLDMFKINLFSIMSLVNELLNLKLRRVFIVNSISGLIGQSIQHEYSASKHALMGYVKSLIKNSKNSGFDVMCINPGGIDTELWDEYSEIETSNFIKASELSKICKSLILTKQKLYIENMIILPEADL